MRRVAAVCGRSPRWSRRIAASVGVLAPASRDGWWGSPAPRAQVVVETVEIEKCEVTSAPPALDNNGDGSAFDYVAIADGFVRAKVLNFIVRVKPSAATATSSTGAAIDFDTTRFQESDLKEDDTPAEYRSRFRFALPAADKGGAQVSVLAEGWGDTPADSQSAALMHAERLIDAAGVPMFSLESRQRRHAEAARAAGRWAPMPGDARRLDAAPPPPVVIDPAVASSAPTSELMRPTASGSFAQFRTAKVNTPPPPASTGSPSSSAGALSRAAKRRHKYEARCARRDAAHQGQVEVPISADGAVDSDLIGVVRPFKTPTLPEDEDGVYDLVTVMTKRLNPSPHAVHSPCIIDTTATDRIKASFAEWGIDFDTACVAEATEYDGSLLVTMTIRLPSVDPHDPPVYAKGKATRPWMAKALCSMHAELLMDHLGLPLFPKTSDRQLQHAHVAWQRGRYVLWDARRTEAYLNELMTQRGMTQDEAELDVQRMVWSSVDNASVHRWYPAAWALLDAPKPLRELSAHHNDFVYAQYRISPLSNEEHMNASHQSFVNASSTLLEIDATGIATGGVASSLLPGFSHLDEAKLALVRFQARHGMRPSYFQVVNRSEQFRASTIVAAPESIGHLGAFALADTAATCEGLCVAHAIESVFAAGLPLFAGKSTASEVALAQRVETARRRLGLTTVDMAPDLPRVSNAATKATMLRLMRGAALPSDEAMRRAANVFAPALRHTPNTRPTELPPTADALAIYKLRTTNTDDFDAFEIDAAAKAAPWIREAWLAYLRRQANISNGARNLLLRFHCLVEDNTRVSQRASAWIDLPLLTEHQESKFVACGRAQRSKNAEHLCLMHLVLTVDALNLTLCSKEADHHTLTGRLFEATARLLKPFSVCSAIDHAVVRPRHNCDVSIRWLDNAKPLVAHTLRHNAAKDEHRDELALRHIAGLKRS